MSTRQIADDKLAGRHRRPLLKMLCFVVIVFVAYSILFLTTVTRAGVMYGIDDGIIQRGTVTCYWFSKDPAVNRAGGVLFSPVLKYLLHCRPYSSFKDEDSYIKWCEAGNDVYIDNVADIP